MKLPIKQAYKNHPKNVRKATVICFIASRGTIIATGYNRTRFAADKKFTYHAEESALKKAGRRRAQCSTMYIIRVKKNGAFGLAKPCKSCMKTILSYNVGRGYHSIDSTNLIMELFW